MPTITVHTSLLFDPKQKAFLNDISITVDTDSGLIIGTTKRDGALPSVLPDGDVDLRGLCVMPGLVDAHTHIFLHAYSEADAERQKRDESIPERIIRAVNHCRTALLAGYTTYRDLGTECMGDFDANVRDAVARGLTPGPRLFVATRVLASTGGNEVRTENAANGVALPAGPDVADGEAELRRAVRRRIAAGADIVKVFVDYRRRIMRSPPACAHPYRPSVLHPPRDPNPNTLLFSPEEVAAVVKEAKMADCPVAAHALTLEGAMMAVEAGVDTVEHASIHLNDEVLLAMREKNTILVPTLGVLEKLQAPKNFAIIKRKVKRAHELGVRMACGGDTGTFSHGDNARELELMIECGIPIEDALEMCTVGGWESCGGDRCGRRFGWWEQGSQADIVALAADPRIEKDALRRVDFVMKDGMIWKRNGYAVGMV